MLALLLAALPELPSRDVGTDPKPFIAIFAIGFFIAVLGHIAKSKTLIASGVLMIFMATFGIPLFLAITR
jgi:hypothetical protein